MTSNQISQYLNRISYAGSKSLSVSTLSHLQQAHLLTVPFENLDIHYGRKIILDTKKIFQKIVESRRGGFCYELNELFGQLLHRLGFNVNRISARVYDEHKGYGNEYDHLALIVREDEVDYLVDVGFGEFASSPLPIERGIVINDPRGQFIFDDYDEEYLRINQIKDHENIPQYIFKPVHKDLSEYQAQCHYHQTSEKSHFTRKKLISIMTPDGRITLTENKLKIQTAEEINEFQLNNEVEFSRYLRDYFSIEMTPDKINNEHQF